MQQQQQQQQGADQAVPAATGDGSSYDSSSPSSSFEHGGAAAESMPGTRTPGASVGLTREVGDAGVGDDDWLDKLAYEMSYDDPSGWHG